MLNNILLEQRHLDMLIEIFKKFCPNAQVIAYGSRVNGDAHEGSDLDLAIITNENIPIWEMKQAISESNIPFLVDIFDLKLLPESFQENIKKRNIIIYN